MFTNAKKPQQTQPQSGNGSDPRRSPYRNAPQIARARRTERSPGHQPRSLGNLPKATSRTIGASTLIQREPDLRDRICYKPGAVPQHGNGECDAREPENCPTYESWIKAFSRLTTFSARDTTPDAEPSGFEVFGPTSNPTDPAEQDSAPAISSTAADAFIDHPTDAWVRACLPDNLRETAYRLPTDCADIAVVLRHVWLSAHHRIEQLGSWTIGDKAGRANTAQVGKVIRSIGSINVATMLNPYLGSDGKPLRTYAELKSRLHPGDVLVWEHHDNGIEHGRTGGHTQTIFGVDRDEAGEIRQLQLLQGNQPISEERAEAIREEVGQSAPSETSLRGAPGRRIELDTMSGDNLRDRELPNSKSGAHQGTARMIWMWADSAQTTLVAAGPPAAAPRPARPNQKKPPTVADWFPGLRRASTEGLQAPFESALLELRGNIEGGQKGLDEVAKELGTVTGERLFKLAKDAKDLGDELLYRPLVRLRAVISALAELEPDPQGSQKPLSELQRVFAIVDDALNLAARGASTISFLRKVPKGKKLIRVLVTGFDPFNVGGKVELGTINPSGAAALALDGDSVVSGKVVAAVEGLVLPVSFTEFEAGLVERIVRPLAKERGVDAVITVSLDENLTSADPVRIERFVVGVHEAEGTIGPIVAAPLAATGPVIIETPSPVDEIASETARPASGKESAIQQPKIGTAVEFRFASAQVADEALRALSLPAQSSQIVSISDVSALRQIVSTTERGPNGVDISFTANGLRFSAAVIEGPGGNYLSNEVSYRVLRLLAEERRNEVTSFHVHTGAALPDHTDFIPQDVSTKEARAARTAALASAKSARATLVATLKSMITAIASRAAERGESE